MTILKIAWRNICRNKRRTILTISTITFGVALTIIFIAFGDGSHESMIRNAIDTQTGNLQIHKKGYQKNPMIEYMMNDITPVVNILKKTPEIVGIAERIRIQALASSDKNSIGVMITGIDPEEEKNISKIIKLIKKGKLEPNGVIVGKYLANNLNIDIGDEFVFITQGIYRELCSGKLKVTGIFKTGITEMDSFSAFITINDMRKILGIDNGATEITIKLKNYNYVYSLQKLLKSKLDLNNYEVMRWDEIMPGILEFIAIDNAGAYIVLAILLIVISFGVMNTVLMSTLERTREIGIIKALGTKPRQIMLMILSEGVLLSIIGLCIGAIIGLAISGYFVNHKIYIKSFEKAFEDYGMEPYIYTVLNSGKLFIASLIVFFVSVASSIYPARKAAKLNIASALKHL